MSLQELFASGLLESYALGMCSPDEERTVQQLLRQHPEARHELEQIEAALETYARSRAIAPPEWMKGRILDNIAQLQPPPTPPAAPVQPPSLLMRPAIWALSSALLALGYFAFVQYRQVNDLQQQQQVTEKAAADCAAREQQLLRAAQQDMAFLTDPATQPVPVQWTAPENSSRYAAATVYFNATQRRALLNPAALPPAPAQRDYQLWVIVEGNPNPIPLNVLSGDATAISYPANAVAFAVSIEPKGGSPNGKPTEVVMLGKV